jgi:hypothetical protein
MEKTSLVKAMAQSIAVVKTGGQKVSSASTPGGGTGHALACAINLYALSAYDEVILLEPRQKRV